MLVVGLVMGGEGIGTDCGQFVMGVSSQGQS
jgi:hypothetical protein